MVGDEGPDLAGVEVLENWLDIASNVIGKRRFLAIVTEIEVVMTRWQDSGDDGYDRTCYRWRSWWLSKAEAYSRR